MFGSVTGSRVAFVVDTSAAMRRLIPAVREQLKSALDALVGQDGARFNLIEVGGAEGPQLWSERLTVASQEMVTTAHEWIDAMRPARAQEEDAAESFEDVADALYLLAEDTGLQAVHFVTCRAPGRDSDVVLDLLVELADGLPVSCVYVCEERPRRRVFDFLSSLAEDTGGSMRAFVVAEGGGGWQLNPVEWNEGERGLVWRREGGVDRVEERHCSVTSSLSGADPLEEWRRVYNGSLYWLYWWHHPSLWSSYFRPTPEVMAMGEKFRRDRLLMTHSSEEAADALTGRHVLARRSRGGAFFTGVIHKKVSVHEFLVTFDSRTPTCAADFETVHITDIIDLDDALRNCVNAGDRVLAPRGVTPGAAYEPAVVVSGFERRGARSPCSDRQLMVSFPDGETSTVEAGVAVWIPVGLHARFLLQLGMSSSDRRQSLQRGEKEEDPPADTYAFLTRPPPTWYLPPALFRPFWHFPLQPRRLPPFNLDMRPSAQPLCPSTTSLSALEGCHITISQSASSIEEEANGKKEEEKEEKEEKKDETKEEEKEEEEQKEEKDGKVEEEEEEDKKEDLQFLEDVEKPYVEKGPLIDGFVDDGHPIALSRPPLREIHRKPPWRYWGQRGIPPYGDGPSFEPYRDPESVFGRPFSMTADVDPRPRQEPPPPRRSAHATLDGWLGADERARLHHASGTRLQAVLQRADIAVNLRDSCGLSRVRADRRERLIRRQLENARDWARNHRDATTDGDMRTRERWAHGQWDWLDRRLLSEGRHAELARSQFRLKARQLRP